MRCRPAGLALVLVIIVPILFAPLAAEAQQAGKVSRIGYLSFCEPGPLDDVFRQGLRDLGWVEGEHLVIALGLTSPHSLLGRADEVIQ